MTVGARAAEDSAPMTSPPDRPAPSGTRARNAARLWRIEGSLTAVASELRQLEQLEGEALRRELADLERRLRAELDEILPGPMLEEMHRLLGWVGDEGASPAELRVGLVQLEGWVGGALSELGIPFSEERGP